MTFQKGHTINLGIKRSEETRKKIGLLHTIHGMTNTRIHNIWGGMLQRCQNPNDPRYYLYGGRGIKVCKRWQTFEHFYKDMKEGYGDELTIDRINNDGNYTPKNCRWATWKQQSDNRRNTRFVEYKGIRDTSASWARFFKIPNGTLWNRLYFLKWPIEKALFTPVIERRVQF